MTGGADAPRAAPFDHASAMTMPDWRADVAWPMDHAALARLNVGATKRVVQAVRDAGTEDIWRVAALAAPSIVATGLPLLWAARVLALEDEIGRRFVDAAGLLDILRATGAPVPDLAPPLRHAGLPTWPGLRRLARTASWTPWPRLPRALLGPKHVAISHNGLLRAAAGAETGGVAFHQADALLARVSGTSGASLISGASGAAARTDADRAEAAASLIVEALMPPAADRAEIDARTRECLFALARTWTARAAAVLAQLAAGRRLPGSIWSGTGGAWASRAVGLEVMRRGGKVTRFDHGGGLGFNALTPVWQLVELMPSTDVVLPTPALARGLTDSGVLDFARPGQVPVAHGAAGDPGIRAVAHIARTAGGRRPRVVYTPTPLLGARTFTPPLPPDPISLDWQLRMVECLKAMPIDLIVRPHPEGLLRGQRHPIADIHPTEPRRFESLIAETDVFVFDYPQSTTFYEALCTDRAIVFLDAGLGVFDGAAARAIEARCRVVPLTSDASGRPQVDPDALAAAILETPPQGDPTAFRAMFLGDEMARRS